MKNKMMIMVRLVPSLLILLGIGFFCNQSAFSEESGTRYDFANGSGNESGNDSGSEYETIEQPAYSQDITVVAWTDDEYFSAQSLRQTSFCVKSSEWPNTVMIWNQTKWNQQLGNNDEMFFAHEVYDMIPFVKFGSIVKIECTQKAYANSIITFRYNKDRTKMAIVTYINDQGYVMCAEGLEGSIVFYKMTSQGDVSSDHDFTWWKVEDAESFYGLQSVTLSATIDGHKVYLHCDSNGYYVDENKESLDIQFHTSTTGVTIQIPLSATYTDSCYYNTVLGYSATCSTFFTYKPNSRVFDYGQNWNHYLSDIHTGSFDKNEKTEYIGVHPSESKYTLNQALQWIENNDVPCDPIVTTKDFYKATEVDINVDLFEVTVTGYEVPLWEDTAPQCSSYLLYAYRQYPLYLTVNGFQQGDSYSVIKGSCISDKIYTDCRTFTSGEYVISGNWIAFKLPNKYEVGIDYSYDWSSLKITDLYGHELSKIDGEYHLAIRKVIIDGCEYLYLYNMPAMGIRISIDVVSSNEKFSARDMNNYAYLSDIAYTGSSWASSAVLDIHEHNIKLLSSTSYRLGKTSIGNPPYVEEDMYGHLYSYEYIWYVDIDGEVSEIVRTSNPEYQWSVPDYPAGTEMDVYCVKVKSLKNAICSKTSNRMHIRISGYNFGINVLDMNSEILSTSDRVFIVIEKNSFDSALYTYDQIFNDIQHVYVTDEETKQTVEITKKVGYAGGFSFSVSKENVNLRQPQSGWVISYEDVFFYSQAFQWVIPKNGSYTFKAVLDSGYAISKTVTVDYLCSIEVLDSDPNLNGPDTIYFRLPENAMNRIASFEEKQGDNWVKVADSYLGNTTVVGRNNQIYSGYFYTFSVTTNRFVELRFKDSNGQYYYWSERYNRVMYSHAHSLAYHVEVSATCTHPGMAAYYSCSLCNHLYLDAEAQTETSYNDLITSPVLAHQWALIDSVPVYAACNNDGYYLKTFRCQACQAEKTDRVFDTAALGSFGHKYKDTWDLVGANGHAHFCKWCSRYQNLEPHVFDNDADETCNLCGYQRTFTIYQYYVGTDFHQTSGYVHLVTGTDTEWPAGWYVVQGTVTIPHSVKVTGNVHLILLEDAVLTINGCENYKNDPDGIYAGIEVAEGAVFSVYGQTMTGGTLIVNNESLYGAAIGASMQKASGSVYFYSGTIQITSPFCSKYLGKFNSADPSMTGSSEGVFAHSMLGIYRSGLEMEENHSIADNLVDSAAVNQGNHTLGYSALVLKKRENFFSVSRVSSSNPVYGTGSTISYLLQVGGDTAGLAKKNLQIDWYTGGDFATKVQNTPAVTWNVQTDPQSGNTYLVLTTDAKLSAGSYYFKVSHLNDDSVCDIVSKGFLLTVEKLAVTLTSESAAKVYDGSELKGSSVTVTEGSFASGEGFSYETYGSQQNVGTTDNTFSYHLNDNTNADDYDITCKTGTLSVTKITTPIVISTDNVTKIYDGYTLISDAFSYTQGVLLPGDVLNVVCTGGQLNVGSSSNAVKSYHVFRDGIDVTGCYTIQIGTLGSLTVKPSAQLEVVIPEDIEKTYDGTDTVPDVTTTVSENTSLFYSLDGITYSGSVPSLRNVGQYTVYVRATNSNYETAEESFAVTIHPCSLEVLGLKAEQKEYDGTKAVDVSYTAIVGIAEGDEVTVNMSASFSSANAGKNTEVEYSFTLTGKDADNYEAPASGSLQADISRKSIQVWAVGQSLAYGDAVKPITFTHDALCGNDQFSGALSVDIGEGLVGSYDIVLGTLTAGDNYELIFIPSTVTIGKGTQEAIDISQWIISPETVMKKGDGSIEGVNASMEYRRKDKGSFVSVPAGATKLVGLVPGTYEIRWKETEQLFAGATVEIEIEASEKKLCVHFEVNGSETAIEDQYVAFGEKAINPNQNLVKPGFEFKHFSTSATEDIPFDFAAESIKDNLTLYAVFAPVEPEESKPEESKAEESKAEESKHEESKPEESKVTEESSQQESVPEESAPGEPQKGNRRALIFAVSGIAGAAAVTAVAIGIGKKKRRH